MQDTSFIQYRLTNGLQIVIERMPHVPSAACGMLVQTGSRDEPDALAGAAHFLEHMCFKGTARRSWEQISIDLDALGAQHNAYTCKDRTFYYGWVRPEDVERQIELLADMMRPTLPPDQFDLEKNVILEEIAMAGDDLASVAYDALYEHLCPNHPMGWPVLGYANTIRDSSRQQMAAFAERRYAPRAMTLIVAGQVDPDRILAAAERWCGQWQDADVASVRTTPAMGSGQAIRTMSRFHQQAVLLAYPATTAGSPDEETAEAVAAILGGTNSRFYWNIVQKGLSRRAGVFYEGYADFGTIVLFALCESKNADTVLAAMQQEVRQLTEEGPQPHELQRVKNLRRTGLAGETEAPYYRLGLLADDLAYRGHPRSAAERLDAVDAVTAERVAGYLERFSLTGPGLLVSVGPREDLANSAR